MTNKLLSFQSLCKVLDRLVLIIIFLTGVTSVQAKNLTKQDLNVKVSLHVVDMPVKDVLKQINKETKVSFVFSNSVVTSQSVSIDVKNEQLNQVLRKLLDPLGLDYAISGTVILIDKKAAAASDAEEQKSAPIKVSGRVVDNTGTALIGVSVKIKGSPRGTVTDMQGHYSLNVPDENATLIFTYIGYTTQEVAVNGRATVDVKMAEERNSLNEVVVTALGISRQKKALAYAVTEVKGDEFTQARENNVANALTGKVAGVNAAGLSTGPGGSSRVIIRGNGSLSGANQPLYVVNGMPIDNTVPGGSATTNGGAGNVDRGDGIAGINPDDIESISVLKGGTAAALYGARAANGVILITTKKGRAQKGVGVDYNTTFTAETPAVFPDWQYEYGQGDGGVKPMDQATAIQTGRRSFGAKIDGSNYVAADGQSHPYTAQKDNIKNFYRTGSTFTNTVAFTGGNEAITYRFSVADLNANSILPNSNYDRKTGNLNLSGKLSPKLSFEALAQYNIERAKNRSGAGDALGNPNWTPYMVANTTDIRWLAPGYDANGNETPWNDASIATNSYFVINKFQERDTKNRFIGQAGVTYELIKNLSIKGVVSRDFYYYNYQYILPTGTLYVPNGQYNELKVDASETNGLLTLNYNGKIKDFGISAFVGGNQQRSVYNQSNIAGSNYIIPYFYSSTNLSTVSTTPTNNKTGINSLMGSADFSFKNYAYLTVTGRQDWFSTLSPKNNSLFYPSVGGSFVLSEAFKLPKSVSYAKLRASWAQVGGGAPDPYQINQAFMMLPSSGQPIQSVSSTTITNANLHPYTSTTTEAGIEARFLNSRLGFDITVYNRKTTDDIVSTAISGTSGYNNVILNVGQLDNKGIEALINGTPVKTRDFSWSASYNVAYNKNEVVRLAEGLNQIQMASTVNGWAYVNNIVGQPYGSIVGTRMLRDAQGNVVFNATTGLPVATGLQKLGNGVAPLTMGLSNDFRYKRFSLNVLLDGKFGNKIFSLMEVYGTRLGLMKTTLPGRDNGLQLTGVDQTGKAYSRVVPVSGLRSYYDNYKSYSELFLHDGSFVKLRQIILSYAIPADKLKVLGVQSASIAFVARNLLTIYKKTDNFDPETSFTNGSSQGFESLGLPRTRSFGVNLMVKF
ncbi:SusC/RagA family TonB-linked outer membrane protein [Mucilaginibacter sp. RS28]|uniref:SusC/RagA family TonB-linked outer membrane protein n=1 Tax=Mucilaginibacter straminoryzae TaxID=2932774 RepID=A0A9X1WZX2_9SPHI|nr:SusC/RagA family TonB-linked outer membrane protein [Mucilaginibacter straminoryzae]MCJ8208493.1 SusC/RagA family TonB-linked outer membrane protein [Mucilaginibacter straminoryzae]